MVMEVVVDDRSVGVFILDGTLADLTEIVACGPSPARLIALTPIE